MSRAVRIEGGGVQVSFTPAGDRFQQEVSLALSPANSPGMAESILLLSREGTADELWPASPPLQDVHHEARPDGKQLLLGVGRAGRSHWSLSCELDPASGRVTFDIACRLHGAAERLGSTYLLPGEATYQGDERAGEVFFASQPICRITAEAGSTLEWLPDTNELTIRPRLEGSAASSLPATHTVRWCFWLELISKNLRA